MKILVVNCGSSSLKYQLIEMENEQVLASGKCDRIGVKSIDSPFIVFENPWLCQGFKKALAVSIKIKLLLIK